jgi:hypothetical protein
MLIRSGGATTRSLLHHLIERPDLARTIQAMPAQAFAAVVREVGIEDAGEIVALATTEQLVHAFDEDLFVNDRAGERETFDAGRFVVWLEVLLEAGHRVLADRVAELDEDFVAHALSALVLVLDEDALRERLDTGDEDAAGHVDKALESALTLDLDGYILVAKDHAGWDAAVALLLALDRNHRALLVRLLQRLARVSSHHLDDLDELSTVLTEGESLADDAEAAREDRRSKQGYVEPRAARAFLALARKPFDRDAERDPLTRAYFRELDPSRPTARSGAERAPALRALPPTDDPALVAPSTTISAFMAALRELGDIDPAAFAERMEELVYLANVIAAGHERDGARTSRRAAADAALATVCYGALLDVETDFVDVLRRRSADWLFRLASSRLPSGVMYRSEELEAAK